MDFKAELKNLVDMANAAIEKYLPKTGTHPGELVNAMRYSVLAGGKRVRPVLMAECWRLFGGKGGEIEPFQAAMEFIHTSSLIHDDLPAIDNDDLRRGKKTTHAMYGEAVGILAGDALLNYSYEVLTEGVSKASDIKAALKAARIIAVKSGYMGMLGGQDVDVENEKTGIKGDKSDILNFIYEKKTSALIEASMMAGAALAGAGENELAVLEEAGRKTGLAFQIYDDILDVTSTQEKLGKPVFSDVKNEKETYVSLFGIEEARAKVDKYTKEAVELAGSLSGDTGFLRDMLSYLALREM
ncbi:MAG TPA: polyprenyl synthetase family protein [Candidatus Alectryocaccobium stercorigallinarum]|nr:polyprenyl synthetase family protein [Candidatus Alectryocaccobium stercorigallinarum]